MGDVFERNFSYAVEKHPYETKLTSKEWNGVKPYFGVRDQEAEDCGFADKAEIEVVRSYIFQHGQVWFKTGMYKRGYGWVLYKQHLNSIYAAFKSCSCSNAQTDRQTKTDHLYCPTAFKQRFSSEYAALKECTHVYHFSLSFSI